MYFLGTFSVLFGIFQTVTSHCDIYVDITNGIRDVDVIIKDDVVYTPDDYFEVGETIQGCICKVKKCLRRCCSEGEALNSTTGRCFQSTDDSSIPGIINFNIINVPENKICEERQYKIKINEDFSFMTGVLMWDNMQFNMKNFCLAITPMNTTYVVACVPNEETQVESIIMSFGMLISMPFLGVTFLVYVILPNPTIHKRALAAYVLSLLLAYICLVTVQLHNSNSGPIADIPCQLLGYSIVFFFTMSFCWLNVMSYDMWSTFKGIYRYSGNTANSSRFYYGLAYAITVPLILVIIILLTNSLLDTTNIGHPKLGLGRCFLDDGYPNLFYFYLPMALVISVNVVLFILTAVRIQQIKKETAMSFKQQESVKHAYEKEKQILTEPATKQQKIKQITTTLKQNSYKEQIINKALNNLQPPQIRENRELNQQRGLLPYIIGVTKKIGRILKKLNIYTTFKPHNTLAILLGNPKDKIKLKNHGVYSIPYGDCKKLYIGQTNRRINKQILYYLRRNKTNSCHPTV